MKTIHSNDRTSKMEIMDIKRKDKDRYEVYLSNVPVPVEMNKKYLLSVIHGLGSDVEQIPIF